MLKALSRLGWWSKQQASVAKDPFDLNSRRVSNESLLDTNTDGPTCSMGAIEQFAQNLTQSSCSDFSLINSQMSQI